MPARSKKPNIGVLIEREWPDEQYHVGIIYRKNESGCGVVDFRGGSVGSREFDGSSGFAVPVLDEAQITAICTKFGLIAKEQSHLQYGFSSVANFRVEDNGQILKASEDATGLTCATFVHLLFDSVGVPLVNCDTWESNEADKEWQLKMIKTMAERNNWTNEYVECLKREAVGKRIRPTDYAGAALLDTYPVGYAESRKAGEFVEAQIQSWFDEQRV